MRDRVGSNKRAFLHGLTTRTDGLSMVFPLSICKACGEEFVNRKSCTTTTCQSDVDSVAVSPAQACMFLMWRRMSSLDTQCSTVRNCHVFLNHKNRHCCGIFDLAASGMVARNTIRPTMIDILDSPHTRVRWRQIQKGHQWFSVPNCPSSSPSTSESHCGSSLRL